MAEYHNKRVVEIIKAIQYATLATVTPDGRPWNSPVYFNYDKDFNIYWVSDKQGQHSINVTHNGQAFIVIYDSTAPEGDGEGVYVEASVVQVTDLEEILAVRKIKKGSHFEQSPDTFLGDSIRYMYKAIPKKIWINDAEINDGIFIRDYRVEVSLEKIRRELK